MSDNLKGAVPRVGGQSAVRIIFLHHSVGADLLKFGGVRERLKQVAPTVELWDHAYNPPRLRSVFKSVVTRRPMMPSHYYGLRDGSGRRVSMAFGIPGDNTDPDGFAALFAQQVTESPSNTLSHLLRFDVIAFKSCFTILPIRTDAQLETYKRHLRDVNNALARYPQTVFVPMTPPPLRASLTTTEQAETARRLSQWMMSDEFRGGRPNVLPFDLFDELSSPEGFAGAHTLRPEFCVEDVSDSHPNARAAQHVATMMVPHLANAAGRVRNSSLVRAAR